MILVKSRAVAVAALSWAGECAVFLSLFSGINMMLCAEPNSRTCEVLTDQYIEANRIFGYSLRTVRYTTSFKAVTS